MLTCVIIGVLYWQMWLCLTIHVSWSFIHVWVVGTQCGFFPLCVTIFAVALFCTLCFVSYILDVPVYILIYIFIILVPFSF